MKKLLLVILFCFIYGCEKQEQIERFMEDGVEVIVNHLEPYKIRGEANSLHLTEEFTIDTENDDIAEIGLTNIYSFDVDSDGSLYFLNRKSGGDFVLKFDQKGNFITSFGRRGQGPGELMRPYYIRVDYKDDLVITDIVGKIVSFGKDGSYKEQVKTEQNMIQVLLLENGNYLINKRIFNPGGNYVESHLLLCGPELEVIKELGKYNGPNYRGKWGFPEDNFVYCVSDGKIFMGNSESGYEIRVYDLAGNLKRKIRKEFRPVEVTKELKKKTMKELEGSPVAFMTDGIFFHKHCPAFQYFFTDDEGHVFVMTYEESENPREYMYDVFNGSGIFVSRIYLENMVRRGSIIRKFVTAKNRRLYCLKEKENGQLELVVYRMRWE